VHTHHKENFIMAVSLTKGGNVNLSKAAPGLTEVIIGLGWDPRITDGAAFDADASAFLLNDTGKVPGDDHFVFYNAKTSPDGSTVHQGDNTTGQGEGDDEKVEVNLTKVARPSRRSPSASPSTRPTPGARTSA
jgi:tellurium resistance protein TerD